MLRRPIEPTNRSVHYDRGGGSGTAAGQNQAVIIIEYELVLFAARDGSLAEELQVWQNGMAADLAEALEHLGATRPFDAARAVIQLVRGYELEQLTRGEARSKELRRRLSVLLDAYLKDSG